MRHEAHRCDLAVRIADEIGNEGPVRTVVNADTQPSTAADIRRPEEVVRIGIDESFLGARRRGAPERDLVVVVMISVGDEQALANEP